MGFRFTDIFRVLLILGSIVIISTSYTAIRTDGEMAHLVLIAVASLVLLIVGISSVIRLMGGSSITSWIDDYWKGAVIGAILGYFISGVVYKTIPFTLPVEIDADTLIKLTGIFIKVKAVLGAILGALIGSIIEARK